MEAQIQKSEFLKNSFLSKNQIGQENLSLLSMEEIVDSVIKNAQEGKSTIVIGGAGTGKTTLVQEIAKKHPGNVVLTSSTGKSAMNLGGGTFHSFFGIGIHKNVEHLEAMVNSQWWSETSSRIKNADLIVIDECSLLKNDQMELIAAVLKQVTGCETPFGGKAIVFTGDFLQLPPIVTEEGLDADDYWLFKSSILKEAKSKGILDVIILEKVYRQEDIDFIEALGEIREGECSDKSDLMMKSREMANIEMEVKPVKISPTNRQVEFINKIEMESIPSDPRLFVASIGGKNDLLRKKIADDCPAQERLVLKVGAQVMIIKNDIGCTNFVNGSLGKIISFSEKGFPVVRIEKNGHVEEFEEHTWSKQDFNGRVLAYFKQIPLRPAYAITIHKSQGLTLDAVEIDCDGIFAEGQMYVALSRVRSLKGLRLLNWDKTKVFANQEALKFYKMGANYWKEP